MFIKAKILILKIFFLKFLFLKNIIKIGNDIKIKRFGFSITPIKKRQAESNNLFLLMTLLKRKLTESTIALAGKISVDILLE